MAVTTNAPVIVPYKPRNWAKRLHAATVRWIVLVLHRRAGKTTAAFNHLQRDAMRYSNTTYAYVAPTFKQAKRIVWTMAKYYADKIPGVKFNASELLITYPNGSQIMILGSDNPDSLRGIALWGCFLDEYPLQSPIIFTEIVTKCLADHRGYCIFGGTPKGKGHFFRVHQVAQKNTEEWVSIYKTIDNSLEEERGEVIDNLRVALEDDRNLVKQGLMTEDEFQQEWYNSFEAAIKGAVYLIQLGKAREEKRITNVPYDPNLPVYTVWDLGISKSDAMAVGFYQKPPGSAVHMIDYLETISLGMIGTAKLVKEKPYVYGKHFGPHDMKHKDVITGKTRVERMAALGMEFEVLPIMGIEDGIDLARQMFNRCWFDRDKCELFVDFIGQYHYLMDEKRGQLSNIPYHDFTSHAADQFRYAALAEEEMTIDEFKAPPRREAPVQDEYVGDSDYEDEELSTGMGKHPMLKGINIGALGHKQ